MKKIVTISAAMAVLAIAGCANKGGTADYSAESAAPYSDSRTAGGEQAVVTTRADETFSKRQHK